MKDTYLACGVGILFSLLLLTKWRFPQALELLSMFGRPAATVFVLGSVVLLYVKDFKSTALVMGLLSVFLLKTIWVSWPRSDEKRLYLEVARDQARFVPENSIDLQFGNKTATHDAPIMLAPPLPFPELLIFPPSSETLHEMCD